jgi:Lrp/AsnC family transcriptional regulator, leucine-responsive regulatory protein
MSYDLDNIDRRILAALARDARISVSQLATEVDLSRPAVAERIDKLERQKIIRGMTAVVDPRALGRTVTAFVSARGTPNLAGKASRTFRDLMQSDEVLEVHTVAGDDCFLIKVRTDSIQSLNALVSKLNSPPLALSTRTTIVMQSHCEKVGGIQLAELR